MRGERLREKGRGSKVHEETWFLPFLHLIAVHIL